jgi:putative ABC transport system ATP-binding protein
MATVQVKALTKDYGEGDAIVHALRGVDLAVEEGAFSVIAGPSGSGKSTLLNLISGLDNPTSGSVLLSGQEVGSLSVRERAELRRDKVGFIFQAYNLFPVLTVVENTEYVLMLQGVGADERRERVTRILERVGLSGKENRFPRELSGGQQQRVAIARAIVTEPSLILADEPTANVDSNTAQSLLDLMEELNQEKNITFVFSSHDHAVMQRSREMILLKDGSIAARGSYDEIQEQV